MRPRRNRNRFAISANLSTQVGYSRLGWPSPFEGRCPPADIGGPVGYETYLRSIADPNSVDHEDMLDFDAPDFDPHVVDAVTLRQNLADLTRYIGRKPHSHGAAGS